MLSDLFEIIKKDLRPLALGALLSILVALYSSYAGLKIGGVYWPIVTTSLVSLAVLKLLGNTDKHEINVMQTAASAGGLLAAGVIFTLPALFMLGLQVSIFEVFIVCIAGGFLGIAFSYILRKKLVEEEKLPFADGTAAASVLSAGDEGGEKAKQLFGAFGIGALFALARDYFALFPSYFNLETLKLSFAKFFSFGSSISLISLAGGFLIGLRFTSAWFAGALVSYFALVPYLIFAGVSIDKGAALAAFAKPLGVGIVIGSGIAYFAILGISYFKSMKETVLGMKGGKLLFFFVFAIILLLIFTLNINPLLSVLAVLGAILMAMLGGRITGEMNVDPMEIFAMIALLAAKFLFGFGAVHLVLLAAVVCISAGISGDILQDFKTGNLLGTPPKRQFVAEAAGILSASLILGFLLLSFAKTGFGTMELPSPQAAALKEIISAGAFPQMLLFGALLGFAFTLIGSRFSLG
ncbi:hypothetical protein COV61_04980, partial [Candidatus Micrarchaeota archaeon CG11_big_fil_rev_8_21_14_0_20_47_5]